MIRLLDCGGDDDDDDECSAIDICGEQSTTSFLCESFFLVSLVPDMLMTILATLAILVGCRRESTGREKKS